MTRDDIRVLAQAIREDWDFDREKCKAVINRLHREVLRGDDDIAQINLSRVLTDLYEREMKQRVELLVRAMKPAKQ